MSDESCCKPGDITITPVHTGFMIGRALPERGPGPWWEYLKVVVSLNAAVAAARELAAASTPPVRIWFFMGGTTYLPVSMTGPETILAKDPGP